MSGQLSNAALEELIEFQGTLKLSMRVLTQQAQILVKGSFSELNLYIAETTGLTLLALSDCQGKLTLLDWMHHRRDLQSYMLLTQQILPPSEWQPESLLYTHRTPHKSLRISTSQKPSLEQLQSISSYRGDLYFSISPHEADQGLELAQYITGKIDAFVTEHFIQ